MRKDRVIKGVLGEESALTPSDMCNMQFRRAIVGGYNRAEVDAFLERVADELESLIQAVRRLREQHEADEDRLEEYRQMEATLRSALVSSQKFGEDIIDTAKREAHTLIEEARLRRARFELEHAKLPGRVSQDIRLLHQQRARLRSELEAILETHRRLLDSLIPEDARGGPSSFFEEGNAPGAALGPQAQPAGDAAQASQLFLNDAAPDEAAAEEGPAE